MCCIHLIFRIDELNYIDKIKGFLVTNIESCFPEACKCICMHDALLSTEQWLIKRKT